MEKPSQLFCIDCGEATPVTGDPPPVACVHCGSSFPSPGTVGTQMSAIPPSGMPTGKNEPDLNPEKFWEIPPAFRSREEADAHHRQILRRGIGTALFVLAIGATTAYYLYSTAPPYRMSDQAEASIASGAPHVEASRKALETAISVVGTPEWEDLKAFVEPDQLTLERMETYYGAEIHNPEEVVAVDTITELDGGPGRYQVDLAFKSGPPASVQVDLTGSVPRINWEHFARYPEWTWDQFSARKNNIAREVYAQVQQVQPTASALEATGIEPGDAVGLALWHNDPTRPIYSVVDRSTPTGAAIEAATNVTDPTALVLTLVPAPADAPSFLVLIRGLVQVGW